MSSEVAQLRQRLSLESAALYQALHGYGAVAKHEIIQCKYDTLGKTLDELKQHMSEDEAIRLTLSILDEAHAAKQT